MEEYEAEGETRGDRRQSGFQVRAGLRASTEAQGGWGLDLTLYKINLCD